MAWHKQRGGRRLIPAGGCRLILPALVCAALLAAACRGPVEPASSVLVEHEISPHPPRVGPATFSLKLSDAAAQPVRGARITLEGNMTHAGMAPVFAEATEVEPGRYRASLVFTMGGDWFILVHAVLPDGRKLEREVDVKGVRAD